MREIPNRRGEIWVTDIKNSCDDFKDLTYDQCMRIAELLARPYCNVPEIGELEEELADLRSECEDWECQFEALQSRYGRLKAKYDALVGTKESSGGAK